MRLKLEIDVDGDEALEIVEAIRTLTELLQTLTERVETEGPEGLAKIHMEK